MDETPFEELVELKFNEGDEKELVVVSREIGVKEIGRKLAPVIRVKEINTLEKEYSFNLARQSICREFWVWRQNASDNWLGLQFRIRKEDNKFKVEKISDLS